MLIKHDILDLVGRPEKKPGIYYLQPLDLVADETKTFLNRIK